MSEEQSSRETPNEPPSIEKSPQKKARGSADEAVAEAGEQKPLDPTRYGDWEKNGRCIDF